MNVELFEFAVDLVDGLKSGIGAGIRSHEDDVIVTIPAHDVKMLGEAVVAGATAETRLPVGGLRGVSCVGH